MLLDARCDPAAVLRPGRVASMTRALRSLLVFLTAALAFASSALAAEPARRLKACIISLNEPQEIEAFRTYLDPRQFELVDIRAAVSAARPPDFPGSAVAPASWLLDACTPETSCDLMIYSAEFAGRFFGKHGVSLSLQEMEEASCQARCAGLFRRPLEVFLLACNTLATKDEDSRTPADYLRVLLDHGFERAAAERVVELRYGLLGQSFRESLRRIFAGVPRIYGFSSVAPRAEYTAPMLARYLRAQPDYAGALLRRASDTRPNKALFDSFKGTSFTQTIGLTAIEAGAGDRDHVCALYDGTRPVVDRLAIARNFLSRPDALTFVPTLEVFVSRHPPESLSPAERSVFAEIQRLDAARGTVLELVRSLDVSALKLELAHFAVLVDWLSQAEFHTLAVDGARQLFQQIFYRPLTSEVVDVMCEITKREALHADFGADDIPALLYLDADGFRLLACLAPSDPRLPSRILPGLESADPVIRMWAAYAIAQLLPLDETVLERLVPYLNDPLPEIAGRMRWVFQASPLSPRMVEMIRPIHPALPGETEARAAAIPGG